MTKTSFNSIEDALLKASNWTLNDLNDEQEVLHLRTLMPVQLVQHYDSSKRVKTIFERAFILEITQLQTGTTSLMAFGFDGFVMTRTSSLVSYNATASQIRTRNSVYEILKFEEDVFNHLDVWTHFSELGIATAWPDRPQGFYF